MGEVFLGHDPRLERRVALKCLIPSAATRDDDQARLLREARAAARLNHPNIAAVYDVLQQDDRTFIVMEYVEGESLAARMHRGRMPFDEVRAFARQLVSALAAAHGQGVIHRDLKPANVHVAPDGTVKVLDFGVAKLEQAGPTDQTVSGSNPGTPIYMSPEQLFGGPVDERSDIYSAGVILYQLATGARPFDETNPVALALAMQSRDPRAAHTVNPEVPRDFSDLLARMLQRDPDRRLASMRDAEALLAATDSPAAGVSRSRRGLRVEGWTPVWIGVSAAAVILAVVLVGRPLLHPAGATAAGPAAAIHPAALDSIAVLPLENLSADANQEYIADGMTETIIAELGRVRSLRVISRQSVMQFKHTRATVPQIASQLGVDAVMTGSVTRDGDRLRVTVSLMEPSPERQIWSETYDRRAGDVLTLSSEVAQTAVRAVKVMVTPDEQQQLARVRPMTPEAQQAYLMGRFFWNKRTRADNDRAVQEFQRAIRLDTGAALAYAGVADCFIVAIDNGWMPPDEAYRQAKTYAAKALELDDNVAEAHAALGAVYLSTLLWSQAEQEFKRAVDLNPGYATARQWYSIELRVLGRFDEAVSEARRAVSVDPLSAVQSRFLATQLYYAGDYAGAAEQLNKASAIDANAPGVHDLAAAIAVAERKYDVAIAEYERVARADGRPSADLAYAYALAGRRPDARRVLADLLDRAGREYVRPWQVALVYLGLDDRARALEWLERAYREREGIATVLASDPRLATLRGEARFEAMLRSSGLRYRAGRVNDVR